MEDSFRYLSHIAVRTYSEEKQKYGIPEFKKYPMPDAAHVRSAIKFFNYVDPRYERELASAILKRMKEYGMTLENTGVGEDNRFYKYVHKGDHLEHHGILGQKWGIRRYQNPDGTLTELGKRRNYKEVKKNADNTDPKHIPKVGENVSNQIKSYLKENKNVLDEVRSAQKAIDDLEESFYDKSNKEKIQKYILEAYDRGVPFDDFGDKVKETPLEKPYTNPYPIYIGGKKIYETYTHTVTPSLLALWNDKEAQKIAFGQWSCTEEYQEKLAPLNDRYYKAINNYYNTLDGLSKSLVGKYGHEKVRTVNRKIKGSNGIKSYMDKRYDYVNDIIRDNARLYVNEDYFVRRAWR